MMQNLQSSTWRLPRGTAALRPAHFDLETQTEIVKQGAKNWGKGIREGSPGEVVFSKTCSSWAAASLFMTTILAEKVEELEMGVSGKAWGCCLGRYGPAGRRGLLCTVPVRIGRAGG